MNEYETIFRDYSDKMNRLANAEDAIAYYLAQVAEHCQEVSDHCGDVARHLESYHRGLEGGIDGIPELSTN